MPNKDGDIVVIEIAQLELVKLPQWTDNVITIKNYAGFMQRYDLAGPHRPTYLKINDEVVEIVSFRQVGIDAEVTVIRGALGTKAVGY